MTKAGQDSNRDDDHKHELERVQTVGLHDLQH